MAHSPGKLLILELVAFEETLLQKQANNDRDTEKLAYEFELNQTPSSNVFAEGFFLLDLPFGRTLNLLNLIWRCPILEEPTLRKNADNLTSEGQVLVLLIVAFFSLPGVQPADNSIIIKITRLQSMYFGHVVPRFIFC